MALSNLLGHKISVTENKLSHYLSGAIVWDSRNPQPAGGHQALPGTPEASQPICSLWTPKMSVALILYFLEYARGLKRSTPSSPLALNPPVTHHLELALSQPASAQP